jgi:hypothetical protein
VSNSPSVLPLKLTTPTLRVSPRFGSIRPTSQRRVAYESRAMALRCATSRSSYRYHPLRNRFSSFPRCPLFPKSRSHACSHLGQWRVGLVPTGPARTRYAQTQPQPATLSVAPTSPCGATDPAGHGQSVVRLSDRHRSCWSFRLQGTVSGSLRGPRSATEVLIQALCHL